MIIKQIRTHIFIFSILTLFFLTTGNSFALDSNRVSFQQQNKKSKYFSLSFGMGISYCDNKSLIDFAELQIPNYNTISQTERFSKFSTGLEFFGGIERQLSKNVSLKADYSYFIKSVNIPRFPNYDYSYFSHQPFLTIFYIIPQEYSFIKFGAGAGYIISELRVKEYSLEKSYTSGGLGLKLEGILNAQISKNVAGYFSTFITKSFQSDLKDESNTVLNNRNNEKVNLSSFGLGLRIGLEVFIF